MTPLAGRGAFRLPPAFRVVHPAPTTAVVALSAALAVIVSGQAGGAAAWRVALVVMAVAGSQVATGALNDWADRERDRSARPEKPIPAGEISASAVLRLATAGALVQLAVSIPLGPVPLLLGAGALASAVAYNIGLSRTPLSWVPYLVSFGLLPPWIATGVGVDVARVLPAVPLVAPFAVAAHLANTLRDWDADAAGGSRSLAQSLGRPAARFLAMTLALAVALAVGAVFVVSGRLSPPVAVLGGIGLGAVALGIRGDEALWRGLLVAAVSWTAAWALATG